jgi:PmbA protein
MHSDWIEKIFKLGANKGFSAQEVYYLSGKNLVLSLYEGEVERFSSSETLGVSYRGIKDGKMGYAYTERMDDDSLKQLIEQADSNAEIIESDDEVFLYDGKGTYREINRFNPKLNTRTVEEKIAFLKSVEKLALEKDARIKRLSGTNYAESETVRRIVNTLGLDVESRANLCYAYTICVAEDGGDTRTGIGYDVSNDLADLSAEKIAQDAVLEAIGKLGAKSVKSGNYPVVFRNETFGELLSAFTGIFDAERVQKNLSPLKNKLGETIAAVEFTLIDDPHLEGGLSSGGFDAEGVPTAPKAIIENGVLKTYLHNLKTAHKDGIPSTGNASKGSYKGTVGISPSNLVVPNGKSSFDALLKDTDFGIYIDNVQGLHAGLNTISGDFSLQCSGRAVENGRLTYPVSQITVSGNFFEMLRQIECIADDQKFTIMAADYIGTPSVRIKGLTVSGE